MRILQINSAKNFGGGEKHFVDLCMGLFESGNEIFVALRKENNWQNKLDFLPDENIFYVPMRNSLDIFSAKTLAKIMRENKIEIIHAHLARDYPIASFANRLFPKTKVILTRHVLFPMKSIHKLTLGNVSKAIAVSNAVEANLEKIFSKQQIVCIPNGIKIEKFVNVNREELRKEFRRQHNISPDAKLIGTVGELKKLKGQEDFVLAANEIVKKIANAHFIIVGKDNSYERSFQQELKHLIKVFGIEERFTFLNWVEDTAPLLSALDLFVSASHSESFGLAILEAMTSGTAIVSTRTKGAEELLKNDFSGKLVPVENPVELAIAVCEVLGKPEKVNLFGKNAQEFARENFSLDKMISETENLYERVLLKNKPE